MPKTDEIDYLPRRLCREKEFSRLSGIAVQTLRNWRTTNRQVAGVRWHRIGGRIVAYDLRAWEEMLDRQTHDAPAVA